MDICLKIEIEDNIFVRYSTRLVNIEERSQDNAMIYSIRIIKNEFINLLREGNKCVLEFSDNMNKNGVIHSIKNLGDHLHLGIRLYEPLRSGIKKTLKETIVNQGRF